MKKLEQKQIPQFAALCILSAGVFGYFVVRLVTPSPAAAGTRPQPAPATKAAPAVPSSLPGSKTSTAATTTPGAAGVDEAVVPPPTPGMRDPFVVGYVDPKNAPPGPVAPPAPAAPKPGKPIAGKPIAGKPILDKQMAALPPAPFAIPSAPPLPPSFSGVPMRPTGPLLPAAPPVPALPVPPAAPTWTVTGVLQSDLEKVAILRSGEARRIVRAGDFVDSVYRVVDVTRSSVMLRHGTIFYQLTLGAVKAAPVKGSPATFGPTPTAPGPAALPRKPQPNMSLSQAGKSLIKLAKNQFASYPAAANLDGSDHVRTEGIPALLRFLTDEAPTH